MENKIKLSEEELKEIIKESVKNILSENEELLDEAFLDKLSFLGKSAANKTKDGLNQVKNNVTNKYNQTKNAINNYRDQMNQYSQNQDNLKSNTKYQKMTMKLANDIQEFLNMNIFKNVSYGKQIQEQGKTFIKYLNYLANRGFGRNASYYRNMNNKMINK